MKVTKLSDRHHIVLDSQDITLAPSNPQHPHKKDGGKKEMVHPSWNSFIEALEISGGDKHKNPLTVLAPPLGY